MLSLKYRNKSRRQTKKYTKRQTKRWKRGRYTKRRYVKRKNTRRRKNTRKRKYKNMKSGGGGTLGDIMRGIGSMFSGNNSGLSDEAALQKGLDNSREDQKAVQPVPNLVISSTNAHDILNMKQRLLQNKNIDEWIKGMAEIWQTITKINIDINDTQYITLDQPVNGRLHKFYNPFSLELYVDKTAAWVRKDKHNWINMNKAYTIGDGSCLVHSFMQSLSPTYRQYSNADPRVTHETLSLDFHRYGKNMKEWLAVEFRKIMYEYFEGQCDEDDRRKYSAGNWQGWLEDIHVYQIGLFLNTMVMFFDVNKKAQAHMQQTSGRVEEELHPDKWIGRTHYMASEDLDIKTNPKVIFMEGGDGHYSSCYTDDLPGGIKVFAKDYNSLIEVLPQIKQFKTPRYKCKMGNGVESYLKIGDSLLHPESGFCKVVKFLKSKVEVEEDKPNPCKIEVEWDTIPGMDEELTNEQLEGNFGKYIDSPQWESNKTQGNAPSAREISNRVKELKGLRRLMAQREDARETNFNSTEFEKVNEEEGVEVQGAEREIYVCCNDLHSPGR